MRNFTFHNPTRVIFGKNTIKEIGPAIRENGAKKVLLVAGGGSIKKNGVYDAVANSLKEHGIEWIEFWGVRPNPVLSKTREAIEIARKNNVDAILAVGGGSVIDTAKSVAAGVYLDNIWDVYEKKAEIEKALPIYTVLTISAAGSEMDQFAVMTDEESRRKWNIMSDHIYPRVSIIDPSAQMSLPWYQTVNGALDALAHIMEYYFTAKEEEAALSVDEALMRTIIYVVDRLQKKKNDYSARASLAWAATLALNGTSGAGIGDGDWASHWIEHAVSALYPDVAHGAGLGVIFPAWILYMEKHNPGTFKRWARAVWGERSVKGAVLKMRKKLKKWKAPVTLEELGIKKADIAKIADKALEVGGVGSLKELNRKDMISILELASKK